MSDRTKPVAPAREPVTAFSTPRLMSVDALRGFDMFWIIGADALVGALHRISQGGAANPTNGFSFTGFLANQLEHVEWGGFRFYDLIFPLFIFIMGVSLVFSLTKQMAQGGRADALKRLFRRFVLLYLIALIYSGGVRNPWPDIRLLGVLNRIALCYLFGGLIFLYFKPKAMVAIAASLLMGYWALLSLVPIRNIQLESANLAAMAEARGDLQIAAAFRQKRNFSTNAMSAPMEWARAEFRATTETVTGRFEPGLNVANHFDFQYLPGKKWDVYYDPEGYLSTFPAIATCLLGVFAGLLLRSAQPDQRKVVYLLAIGAASVLLGFLWGLKFPVIKKIWTSSYVLVAGGYSAMLLGAFFWMVDIKQWKKWCQPFVWMGANSITIYLASNIIGGFRPLGARFVGGDVRLFFERNIATGTGDLLVAIAGLSLAFLFVWFLYRKKIFLRV